MPAPRRSLALLLLANLVPLIGVLVLDWSATSVLGVYWLETLIVGAFTILKLLTAKQAPPARRAFLAVFFTVHFGLFAFVHASFLQLVLDLGAGPAPFDGPFAHVREFVRALWSSGEGVPIAFWSLVASHSGSFVLEYWRSGERERADPRELMFAPYPRIFVMHATVLAGGFLTARAGQPVALLVVLVVVKTVLDALGQRREAARAKRPQAAI